MAVAGGLSWTRPPGPVGMGSSLLSTSGLTTGTFRVGTSRPPPFLEGCQAGMLVCKLSSKVEETGTPRSVRSQEPQSTLPGEKPLVPAPDPILSFCESNAVPDPNTMSPFPQWHLLYDAGFLEMKRVLGRGGLGREEERRLTWPGHCHHLLSTTGTAKVWLPLEWKNVGDTHPCKPQK